MPSLTSSADDLQQVEETTKEVQEKEEANEKSEEIENSPKTEQEEKKEDEKEEGEKEEEMKDKTEKKNEETTSGEEQKPEDEAPEVEQEVEKPPATNEEQTNGVDDKDDEDDDHDDDDEKDEEEDGELPPVQNGSLSSLGRDEQRSPIAPQERFKVALLLPLEKLYTCPQCNDVMRYPVQFEECGHRVCSACFHEYLRVEPRCPLDQAHINKDRAFLDKELNREIMALDAKCTNYEWGCKWEGFHSDAQVHTEKCEYTDILCINDCGAKFQRRFLQKHLDKDCPKRIIPCAFCDDRFLREEKKNHLEDCTKVPLPCPNKCDKKRMIPRDELDKHIEEECPRTKIVCQYEEIGCPHRCSREKLPKHYKTGIIQHVSWLYDLVMKQSQRLDQHHELLQDHGALLESHQTEISDMERVSRNQLIWRIDEYTRKMKEAKSGNTTTLFSPPFNTSKHGYRLCASLCLNGDGKGKGTHISAFISILKGAYDSLLKWPFNYRVTFHLLDQNTDQTQRKHIKFSIKPNPCPENEPFLGQPKMEKNASFGGAKFAKHEEAESRTYVKDDTIFLKITVDCDGSVEP